MGGSSPQARGTHLRRWSQTETGRFIPAGAGNTAYTVDTRIAVSVHPRRRGEHQPSGGAVLWYRGSSPQARGTRRYASAGRSRRRFIPAGAGNTGPGYRAGRQGSVHPRRRGEHRVMDGLDIQAIGSSPQARGTPSTTPATRATRRFIPAGAGNTLLVRQGVHTTAVHPRRRGEHDVTCPRTTALNGSSPQARGTPTYTQSAPDLNRFIPAGAGNTSGNVDIACDVSVHPRRRGEHGVIDLPLQPVIGSSPQARGTHTAVNPAAGWSRFIPAGAGNTPSYQNRWCL